MKMRLHFRLQVQLNYHLCDPIRYRRYTKTPCASAILWYLYGAHWWRKVAPRRHSIPEFEEISFKVTLKLRNRFPVYSGSTSVCLNSLKGIPYYLFGNTKRLCFTQ